MWLDAYRNKPSWLLLTAHSRSGKFKGRMRQWVTPHSIFRYFGKFPPPVARRFINDHHDASVGPVIDTMAGSGTTLVESALLQRGGRF